MKKTNSNKHYPKGVEGFCLAEMKWGSSSTKSACLTKLDDAYVNTAVFFFMLGLPLPRVLSCSALHSETKVIIQENLDLLSTMVTSFST